MTIGAQAPSGSEGRTMAVGVDIAKEKHVAVVWKPTGGASRPFSFTADREGFESFAAFLASQQAALDCPRVKVGMEPTGHYWFTLSHFLGERSIPVALVNPMHTKRMKEIHDNSPDKSDPKDAAIVAELVSSGKALEAAPSKGEFAKLREYARIRAARVVETVRCRNRVHRILDVLFPEALKVLPGPETPTTQAVLRKVATPAEVLQLGVRRLTHLLGKASRKQLGREKAEELVRAAESSVWIPDAAEPLRIELEQELAHWKRLTQEVKQLEKRQEELLKAVPYAERLLRVPGLGQVTVAKILGEAGDLRSYPHAGALVKMAGLNLYSLKSGKKQGKPRITKRGRPALRHAVHMAVLGMIQEDRPLETFYRRLTETNGVCKTKALVAASRKLLRAVHAMVRDGKEFNEEKFEPSDFKKVA